MEQRDNSGALFKNDRKQTDKHPDYRGDITIGGRKFFLSAWLKKTSKGSTFMSLAVKPVEDQRQDTMVDAVKSAFPDVQHEPVEQDDIPF